MELFGKALIVAVILAAAWGLGYLVGNWALTFAPEKVFGP